MSFKKAVKEKAKLRLALCGLAGAGKTYSALAIGSEIGKLMRQAGQGQGRVAVIDSERGSASLYANKFDFDVDELESFSPLVYVDKIKEAERAGYDIIIVDSLSHAWTGKDGALDQKDQAADRGGNSWTAWRNVSPKHNAMIDAIVGSSAHVIATMRTKMEYVQDKDEKGKTEIKKVGLAVVQRDQIEFEFTLVGDIDHRHMLKISKTRCDVIDVGDMFEKPGEAFSQRLYAWLIDGAEPRKHEPAPTAESKAFVAKMAAPDEVGEKLDEVFAAYLAGIAAAPDLALLDKAATGPARPERGTERHDRAAKAYLARKAELTGAARAAS